MTKQISDERKAAYYIGMGIMALGFLLFVSVFVSASTKPGDFSNFAAKSQSMSLRGIGGMALMFIGAIIRVIGARGLAGSGMVLDPKRARSELEPYSRMGGGMLKDALDEADIKLGGGATQAPEKVVMIKCRECGKLNEEDSKFCQECGNPL